MDGGSAGVSGAEKSGRPGNRRGAGEAGSLLLVFGHLLAGLVSFGAGIGAGVYTARLAEAGGPLALWRTTVPAEGMVILAVSVTWLLLGGILHSLVAWRRGVRLADGWRRVGGLLAYNVVVGLLAVPLADLAGTYDEVGSDYGWVLGCLLWLPSLFTVAGAWFLSNPKKVLPGTTKSTRGETARGTTAQGTTGTTVRETTARGTPARARETTARGTKARTTTGKATAAGTTATGESEAGTETWFGEDLGPDGAGLVGSPNIFMINLAMLLSWVPAWAFFSGILLGNADRYMLAPLIPAGTMRIAAVGVVVGVPSILIYLLRRRFVAVLLWDQINPRHLGWSGLVVLVAALLAAQVARFVDPGVVHLVLFGSLLFFYGWFLRYLHRRFPPPEDWNPLD